MIPESMDVIVIIRNSKCIVRERKAAWIKPKEAVF
jgi:hypothetical protein